MSLDINSARHCVVVIFIQLKNFIIVNFRYGETAFFYGVFYNIYTFFNIQIYFIRRNRA